MARRLAVSALLALVLVASASGAGSANGAGELTFYPQAGILWRDLYPNNFVDLDPGPGLRDFACGTQTYDGHTGTDSDIRSFREMDIGVPVFAALDGRVIAVELDDALARSARRNLKGYPQVEVVSADGFTHNPGRVDAILVNAGVSHLSPVWLEILKSRGRLVVPLTTEKLVGWVLKATRRKPHWHARLISQVGIYPCIGGRSRSAEALLNKAFAGGGAEKVRSLQWDHHARKRDCWLHARGFCLSRRRP
jgi:hypothetical protein